jgi:toxin HigB-1
MIKNFRDNVTANLFARIGSRKLPHAIHRTALRKLLMLDVATQLADLLIPPNNRLEKLKGNRKGQYSIRINNRWRICFVWRNEDAYDVEIVDYH